MVERWTLPFDFGGSEMTPAPGGEFVSYADYEAAERKVAELEREASHWLQQARNNLKAGQDCLAKLEAAEEDKARLSEALRGVRLAIMEADPNVLTDTLWMPDSVYRGGTVVDFIDAARAGNGAGWPVPDGWKLVPVEPDNAMIDAGADDVPVYVKRSARRTIAIDTYRAWCLAALPAAPQQGGA